MPELRGFEGWVTGVNGTTVDVIYMDLGVVKEVSLLQEAFFAAFEPDLAMSPAWIAAIMYGMRNIGKASPAAIDQMRKVIERYDAQRIHQVSGEPMTENNYLVCRSVQGRTAIAVYRDADCVQYIPMDANGFDVFEAQCKDFDNEYKPLKDYPPERAARLFAGYATSIGATKEALTCLGNLTTISEQEFHMATAKKAANTKADAPAKAAATKLSTPAKAPVGKAPAAPVKAAVANAKPAAVAKEKSAKGPSAASRFQALIMEGKLTDDKIFETVQKEFNLDDSKRSYVAWYRNHLKKKGEKAPEAKS
jgi:hypothetical protein